MDVSSSALPHVIDASQPRRAHLIGIAGNGMRALADVLLGFGWTLSGSDLDVAPAQAVASKGVRLSVGHAAENVPPDAELVVASDAVPAETPELRRASELAIPVLSYFQMLGRLGVGRRTVAVAGTHGKSTTAALLAHLLIEAGRDPTVVFGATPLGATSGGRAGDCGQWPVVGDQRRGTRGEGRGESAASPHSNPQSQIPIMVVEACEYRANFLNLRPHHAAILGIEPDHFDCYDSLEQLEDAFRRFAQSVPNDGLLLARHDCESTRRVTAGLSCRIETFGLSPKADWSAHLRSVGVPPALENAGETPALRSCFEIRRSGRPVCDVRWSLPGDHNILNALAAAAMAYANGLSADQISAGLATFPGLHRRLELLGAWRGVTLIDDYAHHPTEVTAALAAVRRMCPNRRVWCVFQPHQASRTARLLNQLAASLQNADMLVVAEIFRAREGKPLPGEVTAADLARRTAELGANLLPAHTDKEIADLLETQLAPGDVLVTLGAGDVRKLQPAK